MRNKSKSTAPLLTMRRLLLAFVLTFLSLLYSIYSYKSRYSLRLFLDSDDSGSIILVDSNNKIIDNDINWNDQIKYKCIAEKTYKYIFPRISSSVTKNILRKILDLDNYYFFTEEEPSTIKQKLEKAVDGEKKIKFTYEEKEIGNIFFFVINIVGRILLFNITVLLIIQYFNKKGDTLPFSLKLSLSDNSYAKNYIPDIRFKDIGGCNEAKEALREVIDYFRTPHLFKKFGVNVSKGILLVGPPGNGKTLLAKALAGECKLPFLFRSGSEFEEVVVGLGARRIRNLFEEAHNYPEGCIVFIDEIDSIGKKRTSIDNTNLTTNQLLTELDGFYSNENIFFLAATNAPEILDGALLRPGRFDRQIHISLPNLRSRREIIEISIKNLSLDKSINLDEIAEMTRGFSGAQIKNLFNEAAILSLRCKKKLIDGQVIFEAYEKVLLGSISNDIVSPSKRSLIAYHEAGHAIVGISLPETIVKKITIVPRLRIGGYTWVALKDEKGDSDLISKREIMAQITSLLGGWASEKLTFGSENITTGAHDDIARISELTHDLVLNYGMSNLEIIQKPSFYHSNENRDFYSELSEATKSKIDQEKRGIIEECKMKALLILEKQKEAIDLLADILLQNNSLNQRDINFIFINRISPFIHFL